MLLGREYTVLFLFSTVESGSKQLEYFAFVSIQKVFAFFIPHIIYIYVKLTGQNYWKNYLNNTHFWSHIQYAQKNILRIIQNRDAHCTSFYD